MERDVRGTQGERSERGERRPAFRPRVAVVGSLNMDLVCSAPHQPSSGETLVGTAFGMFIGGKGANQAVAAARAGAQVEMIGRLGTDSFGRDIAGALENEGIGLRHVTRDVVMGTGVAQITVEPGGTNSIIVVPNANMRVTEKDVQRARGVISASSVLLLQLETPIETSIAAAKIARQAGAIVILNPAPAGGGHPGGEAEDLPAALLRLVDVLTPNQQETRYLTGVDTSTGEGAIQAAERLRARGVKTVLLTLGEQGALLLEQDAAPKVIPSFPVRVVDTTAAGDSFCGALAVALGEDQSLEEAARFACAAGALACTVMGAGPSLPLRYEIERLLASSSAIFGWVG